MKKLTRKLTILIIEDDEEACSELENYIAQTDDLKLAAITGNSNEAIELTKATLPDVVLLDLELHMGGGNGLFYLMALKDLELPFRPYILITTNNTSRVTLEQARIMGADFILAKYESDYSTQYVVEFIRMMKDGILAHQRNEDMPQPPASPKEVEQQLIRRIRRELNLIGISPKAKGLNYLIDAILMTIESPTPNISRVLADKYKKSGPSIDRAMQNAINRAWKESDTEDLLKYYTARIRSDKGVPTLMEFISYYAGKIESEMDEMD